MQAHLLSSFCSNDTTSNSQQIHQIDTDFTKPDSSLKKEQGEITKQF